MTTEPVLASRPWLHRGRKPRPARNGNLTIKVLYDPNDLYSGWMDKLSWKISATEHLRTRRDRAKHTNVVSSQLFSDGMRFAIYDGLADEPKRTVTITGGYAVDERTGERLVVRKNSIDPVWEMPS